MRSSCSSVLHHLAIAASSAESLPALRSSMKRSTMIRTAVVLVASSASTNRVFCRAPIGLPNALRSRTY
ncbi:Uncharacterised protein [Mycobacteroides abscessus subsp. abscessus]|nr:Uncharacterised protein [Mycobacteroides abscessus subsp. abscessus]